MIDSVTEPDVTVYLGLGSNLQRSSNLRTGLNGLSNLLTDMDLSPVFVSEAVGIKTDLFFNMVVRGHCRLSLAVFIEKIKDIEKATGRDRNAGEVSLDIDILIYGDLDGRVEGLALPNPEILTAAHVLYPLSMLAKSERHPVTGATYGALWKALKTQKRLWPIPFEWRGLVLTPSCLLDAPQITLPPVKQPTQYICGQAVY